MNWTSIIPPSLSRSAPMHLSHSSPPSLLLSLFLHHPQQAIYKQGGRTLIRLGDSDVDYDPNFK